MGMTRNAAAGLIDTDELTVLSWIKSKPDFAEQVKIAEQAAEARYISVIAKAANEGDWQAAKYWLSHRRRRDWGDSVHVQLDIEIQQLISQLTGTEEPIEIEGSVVEEGEEDNADSEGATQEHNESNSGDTD